MKQLYKKNLLKSIVEKETAHSQCIAVKSGNSKKQSKNNKYDNY